MDTVASVRNPAVRTDAAPGLGRFAAIACAAGAGLLVCSIANQLSRATVSSPDLLYWAGILMIALPIFYRLTSREAGPGERLALICLLGLGLYGVKLVRDAPIFTFSDEFLHAFNSDQISAQHHLFHANSILEITRYYPGLEGATSALRTLTGMSAFAAGSIVIGAARLTMMSAMFALFWRVSGSHRIAGIGTAIYVGNFNFLFWSVQYSYESMALPLLMVVFLAVAEVELVPRATRGAWRLVAAIATAGIVITHHVTSYVLVISLTALSMVSALLHRIPRRPNPWPLALLALAMTIVWLFVVASSTVGYLSPVLTEALRATLHTAAGEAPARQLFQGTTETVGATPTLARAIALLAIVLLAVGLPFGLRVVWRRYRREPFAIVFGIAAIGFFGALALRLAPAAWETGNRASEFLFIGLAFVLACVGLETWRPRFAPRLGRVLALGAFGVILSGGAITGWPWDSQLALPVRAKAAGNGATIDSPPLGVAEWARDNIAGGIFAAVTADARTLLDPGHKIVYSDFNADIIEVIPARKLEPWAVPEMRELGVRFVVADRREISTDGIRGYYFPMRDSPRNALLPVSSVTKFEQVPGVARIFDGGPIVVFDLDGRRDALRPGTKRPGT